MFGDINEFARDTGWLHGPLLAYASYGVALFGALLVAGWWVARGRTPRTVAAALWAGAGTILAIAVNQPLVNGFHEARPYTDHSRILVLATPSADYSFPSDHAVMAGAVAAGLWLVDRRLAVLASAAAVLMAFTRVYIAAHYPHDVIIGLGVGATVVLLGWALLARPLTAVVARLGATPLRPLLASSGIARARNPSAAAGVGTWKVGSRWGKGRRARPSRSGVA